MKKNLSLCMALSLMLSISGQTHAVTFKEQAERIMQKAIALAKKGGKYSKKLWDKINFMNRAIKESRAANEALSKCEQKHCGAEMKAFRIAAGPFLEVHRVHEKAEKCKLLHCPNELERSRQVHVKKGLGLAALGVLIHTVFLAAVVAAGRSHAYRQEQEQEQERLKEEAIAEKQKISKQLEGSPKSPLYEAPE